MNCNYWQLMGLQPRAEQVLGYHWSEHWSRRWLDYIENRVVGVCNPMPNTIWVWVPNERWLRFCPIARSVPLYESCAALICLLKFRDRTRTGLTLWWYGWRTQRWRRDEDQNNIRHETYARNQKRKREKRWQIGNT